MENKRFELKLWHLLYVLIFIVAAFLRFSKIGVFPLIDQEAQHALTAASGTPYGSAFFQAENHAAPLTAYEMLTRFVFQLFGASELTARFIPALAGTLLVLTPLLARRRIGITIAMFMSGIITLSPIFVTSSRTAGSASLAALGLSTFVMAILGASRETDDKNLYIAPAGLGLMLASGGFGLSAMLVLFDGLVLWRLAGRLWGSDVGRISFGRWPSLREKLWIAIVVAIVLLTLLGWSFSGLSGFFESISTWLSGWVQSSETSWMTVFAVFVIYEPALLLIGLLGIWWAIRERDQVGVGAISLAIAGFFFILLYRGRHPQDLQWLALPLTYLSSQYIVEFVQRLRGLPNRRWIGAMAAIVIILAIFAFLQMQSYTGNTSDTETQNELRLAMLTIGMILVLVVLFGMGWDWTTARYSLLVAFGTLAILISISSIWRLNFNESVFTAQEMWRRKVTTQGLQVMVKSLITTSQSSTGTSYELPLQVEGSTPFSIAWALREYPSFQYETGSVEGASPIVIAKGDANELALNDEYVGQTIVIAEEWGWSSPLPPEFFIWLFNRNPPIEQDTWLILARDDIAFFGELDF
ncbi:MAG: hypothetical protein GTO18_02325 [Anaerolineales bacterium]|nr:hypothetical protein [Anaerolineales bacterium]